MHQKTHARYWVFAQIVDGIDSVVLKVGKVSNKEFEICSGNDFEGRMRRMGQINEVSESIASLARGGSGRTVSVGGWTEGREEGRTYQSRGLDRSTFGSSKEIPNVLLLFRQTF